MNKLQELRNKRHEVWNQAKAYQIGRASCRERV